MKIFRVSTYSVKTIAVLIALLHSTALSVPNYGLRFGGFNETRLPARAVAQILILPLQESFDLDFPKNYKTIEDFYKQQVSVCIDGYEGFPPNCSVREDRPHCQYSTSCFDHEACIGGICDDPCRGIKCGYSAHCIVQRHGPKCVCETGFVGNPSDRCYPASSDGQLKCQSEGDPCGPEKTCQVRNGGLQCLCSQSSSNSSPDCKPRHPIPNSYCFVPDDCADDQTCNADKCLNPCDNFVCGVNAECFVENHEPVCGCNKGFKGDPYLWCESTKFENNCFPNPCNETVSKCQMPEDDWPICECEKPELCTGLAKFKECREDSECPNMSACIDSHCRDPCVLNPCKENEFCLVYQQKPRCANYLLLNLRKWKH